MDVVYTFQTGQAAVPGALRRQPSVVSQHNDATAAKTLSSPTHVGLSSSSSLTNSAGAAPPAAASSSTAGSESVPGGQITPRFSGCTHLIQCFKKISRHVVHVSRRCLHFLTPSDFNSQKIRLRRVLLLFLIHDYFNDHK